MWITNKYHREQQFTITFIQFIRLIKELHWLQFLFNHANYPVIYRNLRYVLEMMSQAWYIEWKYPNLDLNEQIDKIIEEKVYGWNLVRPVFCEVLGIDEEYAKQKLHPTWIFLNKHVHPSAEQMNIVAEKDFSSLVTDSFNDDLARTTLRKGDKVFDLIYTLVFNRFPQIAELASESEFINEWEEHLPYTMRTIKTLS